MSKLLTVYDDNDSLNNVICALTMPVDEVFYVYHHETPRTTFSNIRKVIKNHKDIKVNFILLEDDEKQIRSIIDRYPDIIFDVGGAKYLSLLLFDMADKKKNRVIYYDDEENVIKDYVTHTVIRSRVVKLNIEDILTLRGGKIKSSMHDHVKDPISKKAIVSLVESNLDNYSAFIRFITRLNSILNNCRQAGKRTYILNEERLKALKTDNGYPLAKGLFIIEGNRLTFRTETLKDVVRVSGAFLENYLYIKLNDSKKFDEVRMSVVVDFSSDRYQHPVRCEIDCMAVKNNRLAFVSCKSSKADTPDLNEIYVHNSMFGNTLSVPVLFVGEEMDRKFPSIYAKAEELGIYILDRSGIRSEGAVGVFSRIFSGTYSYDELT